MKLVMDSRWLAPLARPEASLAPSLGPKQCLMAEAASADNDINSDDRRRRPLSLPPLVHSA